MTTNLEIRRASDDDLATLVAKLGERHWFADRLARQQRGGGVLLVAWLEDRPVGEVFLDREPAKEPEIRRHLPGVPQLDHLEVPGAIPGAGHRHRPDPRGRGHRPPAWPRADCAGRGSGQPQGAAAV